MKNVKRVPTNVKKAHIFDLGQTGVIVLQNYFKWQLYIPLIPDIYTKPFPPPKFRIPKEEMYFQRLDEITENLEESATRSHNLALFNRLLSSASSPTNIVGGVYCRTSAQLQPLTRPISPDSSYSDREERYVGCNEGAGGSVTSDFENDTQCTICRCGGTSDTLSAQELNPNQATNGEHEGDTMKKGKNEGEPTVLKIPPPSTRVLNQNINTNRFTPDIFSFQPIGDQAKVMTSQSSDGNALSSTGLMTVPSFPEAPQRVSEEQRRRSISMSSDVNCLFGKPEE